MAILMKNELNLVAPFNRLLIKEIEVENKTVGGILLSPNTTDTENKTRFGEVIIDGVVKVNEELQTIPKGTKLYFGKFAGAVVDTVQGKFISIDFNDIACIEK